MNSFFDGGYFFFILYSTHSIKYLPDSPLAIRPDSGQPDLSVYLADFHTSSGCCLEIGFAIFERCLRCRTLARLVTTTEATHTHQSSTPYANAASDTP